MRKMQCNFCHANIGHAKVCPHCGTTRAKKTTVGHTKTHAPVRKKGISYEEKNR
jgi:primosomal protein N'